MQNNVGSLQKLTYGLLFTVLLFGVLYLAKGILVPLALALVFALLILPLVKKFTKWGYPQWASILTSMLLTSAAIFFVCWLVSTQIGSFYKDAPVMEQRLNNVLSELQERFGNESSNEKPWTIPALIEKVKANANSFLTSGSQFFVNVFSALSGFLAQTLLVLVYTYFILAYRRKITLFAYDVTGPDNNAEVQEVIDKVKDILQNYVAGLFTVIALLAVLNSLGLFLMGVDHFLFFGCFAALLTIVPYIGVFIGSSLPIVYSFLMYDNPLIALGVFIWFGLIQFMEGNIITPKITGDKVAINPLASIVALLLGNWIWGIPGMIVAVPFMAIFKVIAEEIPQLHPLSVLIGEKARNTEKRNWRERFPFLSKLFKRKG